MTFGGRLELAEAGTRSRIECQGEAAGAPGKDDGAGAPGGNGPTVAAGGEDGLEAKHPVGRNASGKVGFGLNASTGEEGGRLDRRGPCLARRCCNGGST